VQRRDGSRRWWVAAAATALVLAAGCSTPDASVQASGPTSSGAPTTAPPTTGGSGGDKPTSTKPKGAELGGLIKPEASTAFLTKVAQQTRAANTGRFSLTIEVDGATGTSGHVTLTDLSGAYDKDNNRSQIKIDMSGLVAASPDAATAEGVDPMLYNSPIEIVQDGDTQYIKLAALSAVMGGGKEWMKTDGADQAGFAEIFDTFKVEDISGFLATLQASGSVTEVGTEDLDGVDAIHYHADIDPSQLDTTKNADAGKLLSSFEGAKEAAVDVWVDSNALVRKLSIAADAGALGTNLGASFPDGTATLTMGLSDLSQPIEIDIPSEDEVFDMNDLGGLGLDPTVTDPTVGEDGDSTTALSMPF